MVARSLAQLRRHHGADGVRAARRGRCWRCARCWASSPATARSRITMAAESAPPEHMATAIGWVQTAQRLGPALGPVIGGTLAPGVGLRQTFLVAAVLYLGALVLVFVGYREEGLRAPRRAPAAPPVRRRGRPSARSRTSCCSSASSSACSSSIAASAPCCRCTCGEIGTPPDHVAVPERLAVHDHGRRRRARPSPGGQAAEAVAVRRKSSRRPWPRRRLVRSYSGSGRRRRCSSRRPWSSASASASRRRRSTRRRGERAPVVGSRRRVRVPDDGVSDRPRGEPGRGGLRSARTACARCSFWMPSGWPRSP